MKDNLRSILKLFVLVLFVLSSLEANEKAELKANDFTSENVLHDAVRANDIKLVKFLIKQGIDVNTQDDYGYTPLHLAVRLHDYNITSYLISNNAKVNTQDTYKDTPLIDSTRNNDTNISKLLICNGANRNVVDVHGMTTLHNSTKNKNQEIVNLLRVDNLKPYCQKELEISMNPFQLSSSNINSYVICGDIKKGFATELKLEFKDEDDEVFGPFDATFDNKSKIWCLDTTKTTLEDDVYEVKAIAKDYVPNIATDTNIQYTYTKNLSMEFDDTDETTYPYPRICGRTNSNAIDTVDIILHDKNYKTYGSYHALIDDKKKTWCADVTDKLPHGYYSIEGYAIDLYDQFKKFTKEKYFVNTADFSISIDEIKEENNLPSEVCGTSNKTNVQSINITFIDENLITYQLDKSVIDNKNKTWCAKLKETPPLGSYSIQADAVTTKKEKASDIYDSYELGWLSSSDKSLLLDPAISIDNTNETLGNKPRICGKILGGNIVKAKILITDDKNKLKGTYKARLDKYNKTWCANVTDELKNGLYDVKAEAFDRNKVNVSATNNFEVYVIPGLYNALMEEFKDDMKKWDAQLDKNTLTFRFNNPDTFFQRGKGELKKEFKNILSNFFPRYVTVAKEFEKHIQNIVIEGHSSSEHRLARDKKKKFELNKILSAKRANSVLSYTNTLVNEQVVNNIVWIVMTFKTEGLSSSKPVYNDDGSENKQLSRRVDFRIKNIRSELK